MSKKSDDVKREERDASPTSSSSTVSISPSVPYSESFDHIVTMESTYDFHRQMSFEDLQRHREVYEKTSEKIAKMRKQLCDSSLDSMKRKWIEDDLNSTIRKQESALSRIKLSEKLTRRDMSNDPPPAYQPEDPLGDLRKDLEKMKEKIPKKN